MAIENEQTEMYIRAAMTAARGISGRELAFTDDGIVVTDPLGDKHRFTTAVAAPSVEEILALLPEPSEGNLLPVVETRAVPGLGSWSLKTENAPVIRPERQRFAALEALIDADPGDLAKLRSLYGLADTDIFVSCEGETRARDIAIAFACELALTGHDARLQIPPEENEYSYGSDLSRYQGEDIFIPDVIRDGQSWDVALRKSASGYGVPRGEGHDKLPATAGRSRIVVWEDRRMAYSFRNADKRAFSMPERRQVIVGIEIVRSRPVAKMIFSDKAELDCTTAEKIENAPWTRYNARKAARLKARPPAPKTWHQTTQDVAEAFVARQAPRGYVSGKALYFHGPVAYSLYDNNPVAAFVDLEDGRTLLFTGRDSGQIGTLAGTVTSARNDLDTAFGNSSVLRFDVGHIGDLITIGDLPLNRYAGGTRNSKNEHEYPRSCAVDLEKLSRFISNEREAALAELDEAFSTSMPTYRKAGAYRRLEWASRFRDTMSELFRRDFPDAGSASEYRDLAQSMEGKARKRQLDLEEKRKEESKPAAAPPFFQIAPR